MHDYSRRGLLKATAAAGAGAVVLPVSRPRKPRARAP
ncbi:twin-arginine translocation signal domain-containing protein [Streptomyces mirabilis]|nr:twin-arginine translocation signal domain-containing protein [Streptomyces mirabilis]